MVCLTYSPCCLCRRGTGYLQCFFFFQAEDGIRYSSVTGVQTCALPISDPAKGGASCAGVACNRVEDRVPGALSFRRSGARFAAVRSQYDGRKGFADSVRQHLAFNRQNSVAFYLLDFAVQLTLCLAFYRPPTAPQQTDNPSPVKTLLPYP